jgi:translocator protein
VAEVQRSLEGSDTRVLVVNIGAALALVLIVNAGVFAFADDTRTSTQGGPLIGAIPGWVIGAVWTVLFVALAATKWRVQNYLPEPLARRAATWVIVLLIACAAYPLYTGGLRWPLIGLFGNVATAAMAAFVALASFRVDSLAALGPLAVVAWVSFASVAIVDQARWLW